MLVMYFDLLRGALHTIGWVKFFWGVSTSFSITHKKEEEKGGKFTKKGILPACRCYSKMLANTQPLIDLWKKNIFLNYFIENLHKIS